MTIHRQRGQLSFECDACGEVLDADPGQDFADAWSIAKREGWRGRRLGAHTGDEWAHYCPRCAQKGGGS